MVCDSVIAYVCVLPLCVCVCVCVCVRVRVSSQDYSRTYTCTCNRYYFVIFISFLIFLTFNIALIGPVRSHETLLSFLCRLSTGIFKVPFRQRIVIPDCLMLWFPTFFTSVHLQCLLIYMRGYIPESTV